MAAIAADHLKLPELPLPKPAVDRVFRGGGGQLSEQTQEVLGNLFRAVQPHVKEMASILGCRASIRAGGMIAKLTGLNRPLVNRQIAVLEARRFSPKVVVNRGGRKKRKLEDKLLDLSAYFEADNSNGHSQMPSDGEHSDEEQIQVFGVSTPMDTEVELLDSSCVVKEALRQGSSGWLRDQWGQEEACPYKGIACVGNQARDQIVGLRLCSLVLRLVTSGCSLHDYSNFVQWLDSHLPGEFGQIGHSRRFANEFTESAAATLRALTTWDLHTKLTALGIPSDYCRVVDGMTTSCGEPLLVVILLQFSRLGAMQWHLLDLVPYRPKAKGSTVEGRRQT